jgi:hypothetical protein
MFEMSKMLQEMCDAFLSVGDLNVIAVDWGGGSSSMYSQVGDWWVARWFVCIPKMPILVYF